MTDHTIRPVAEYLVNGPIPADELMEIDALEQYIGMVVDSRLDIHIMLERVAVHGAPVWWEGTVLGFEQEFHRQYHRRTSVDNQEDNQRNQILAVELLMDMWMEHKG